MPAVAPSILLLLVGALMAAFALLYVVADRIRNFGIVDVGWAAAFAPVAAVLAAVGPAPLGRRLLVAGVVTAWSLRLALHLGRRVWRLHPREDGRYEALRREWAGQLPVKMGLFFQAQAWSVALLSWPVLLVCGNPDPARHALEWVGAAVVLLGVGGEALADAQLSRFKAQGGGHGRVCDAGLWRYSRHPNYFFEWVVWVGFALLAAPAPLGWTAVACPAVMLFLLLRVTGIRYTEAQLERSKGEAYRAYRQRTSAFVPWFPRKLSRHD